MSFRPFSTSNPAFAGRTASHPLAALRVACLFLAGAMGANAGSEMLYPPRRAPLQSTVKISVTPAPTSKPKVKFTTKPHLVAVGPITIDVKPVAGPRLRQPPLLPPPKVVEPDPVDQQPAEPTPPPAPPVEPSVLSPDSAPVLLPTDKSSSMPVPDKKPQDTDHKDGLLTPSDRAEQDLRDAVMYFETPVGPNGARVTVPLAVPYGAAVAPVPIPESRATYTTEKKAK